MSCALHLLAAAELFARLIEVLVINLSIGGSSVAWATSEHPVLVTLQTCSKLL